MPTCTCAESTTRGCIVWSLLDGRAQGSISLVWLDDSELRGSVVEVLEAGRRRRAGCKWPSFKVGAVLSIGTRDGWPAIPVLGSGVGNRQEAGSSRCFRHGANAIS